MFLDTIFHVASNTFFFLLIFFYYNSTILLLQSITRNISAKSIFTSFIFVSFLFLFFYLFPAKVLYCMQIPNSIPHILHVLRQKHTYSESSLIYSILFFFHPLLLFSALLSDGSSIFALLFNVFVVAFVIVIISLDILDGSGFPLTLERKMFCGLISELGIHEQAFKQNFLIK